LVTAWSRELDTAFLEPRERVLAMDVRVENFVSQNWTYASSTSPCPKHIADTLRPALATLNSEARLHVLPEIRTGKMDSLSLALRLIERAAVARR
jgi:hypothetical protein